MVRDLPQEADNKTAMLKKDESKMGALTLGRNKEKKNGIFAEAAAYRRRMYDNA